MNDNKTTTPDLKHSILGRIDEEQIVPCPRARFMFTNGFFSFASLVSVAIGAVAVAVTIFTTLNSGWEYYEMTHTNLLTFTFNIMPYLWIVVVALTALLGYFNIRHTKRGYKYPLYIMVLGIVGSSLVGGVTLYVLKVGSSVDFMIGNAFPEQYRSAVTYQKEMWHKPEAGRLFGMIATTTEDHLEFKDIEGNVWQVNTLALKPFDESLMIQEREVRLIGVLDAETMTIDGCAVLPGIEEMPPSFTQMKQRNKAFHDRIQVHIEMNVATNTDPVAVELYENCHDLVVGTMPRRGRNPEGLPEDETMPPQLPPDVPPLLPPETVSIN